MDDKAKEMLEISRLSELNNERVPGSIISTEHISIVIENIQNIFDEKLDKSMEDYVQIIKEKTPPLPSINISLKDLYFSALVPKSDADRYKLPSFFDGLISTYRDMCCKKVKELKILKNLNLYLESKTSYLLMGPPCSGTSSLLKLLAGRIEKKNIRGSIEDNGKSIYDYNWKNIASYCGQLDVNHPLLTVEETLQFILNCSFGELKYNNLGFKELDEAIAHKVKAFQYLLGLNICKDTIVGNEVIRGCSGGEKRRVNICESILGQNRVFLLDKISTGLDSAVAYDICKFLTTWTKIMEGIMVCHLTQPDPQVIGLFDKVIILEEGNVIYCGNTSNIIEYFSNLNCCLPEGRDFGSFISEMGHMDGRKEYIKDPKMPIKTTREMIENYERGSDFCSMKEKIKAEVTEKPVENNYTNKVYNQEYAHSFFYIVKILFLRQVKFTIRNKSFLLNRIFQDLILSLLYGWIFSGDTGYIAKYGMFKTYLMTLYSSTSSSVVDTFKQKNVMYKQVLNNNYSQIPYAVSCTLIDYPLTFMDIFVFGTFVYLIDKLTWSDNGAHYFIFLASMFLSVLVYNSYIKVFSYAFHFLSTYQAFQPFFQFFVNSFGGFNVTVNNIPKPLLIFYWLSPVHYGLQTIAMNEFLSPAYNDIYPGTDLTRGQIYLRQFEFPITTYWIKWNLIIMIFEHFVCVGLQMLILTYIKYDPFAPGLSVDKTKIPVITDETQELKMSKASTTVQELPFRSACFTFSDVCYYVKVKDKDTGKTVEKQLLNNISGFVRPYSMVALMGSSGAGKTTLLDVLASRKTQGRIDGKFLINGIDYTLNDLCRISGYVEQDDTLPISETIKEALTFSAKLRCGNSMKIGSIEKFVDEMIYLLELEEYENLMIGKPGTGLPVGVRKLVMVGIELVANPAILFLDEPTTGLDSSAALLVCKVLQRIAATGRSIICTIHQPSEEVFALFTDILLLERGGKVVYFGQSDEGKKMIEYFSKVPGVKPKEPEINPATWMLDTIGAGVHSNKATSFSEYYKSTNLYERNMSMLGSLENDKTRAFSIPKDYASSIMDQCKILTRRTFRMGSRRLDYNLKRYQVGFFMALMLGLVWFRVKTEDQAGVQSKWCSIFFTAYFLGMNNITGNIPILIENRLTYYREISMRTYSPIAQLFALTVMELFYTLFLSIMFQTISYFLVGFTADFVMFLFHNLLNYLFILNCVYLGQLFSYALPTPELATLISSMVLQIMNLLSGYMVPYPNMLYPWKAIYWIIPTTYVMQGVACNQFESDYHIVYGVPAPNGTIVDYPIRDYFIEILGIRYNQKWINVLALFVFIIVGRFITGVVMYKIKYISR